MDAIVSLWFFATIDPAALVIGILTGVAAILGAYATIKSRSTEEKSATRLDLEAAVKAWKDIAEGYRSQIEDLQRQVDELRELVAKYRREAELLHRKAEILETKAEDLLAQRNEMHMDLKTAENMIVDLRSRINDTG